MSARVGLLRGLKERVCLTKHAWGFTGGVSLEELLALIVMVSSGVAYLGKVSAWRCLDICLL